MIPTLHIITISMLFVLWTPLPTFYLIYKHEKFYRQEKNVFDRADLFRLYGALIYSIAATVVIALSFMVNGDVVHSFTRTIFALLFTIPMFILFSKKGRIISERYLEKPNRLNILNLGKTPIDLEKFISFKEKGYLICSDHSLMSFLNGEPLQSSRDRIKYFDKGDSTTNSFNAITVVAFICFAHNIDIEYVLGTCKHGQRKLIQEDLNKIIEHYFDTSQIKKLPVLKGTSWFMNNDNLKKVLDRIKAYSEY